MNKEREQYPEILTPLEVAFICEFAGFGTATATYQKALARLGRPAVVDQTAKVNACTIMRREPVRRLIQEKQRLQALGLGTSCPNCGTALSLAAVGTSPTNVIEEPKDG